MPDKGKGVPKNLLEFVDTYIVTSGKSYNLQVWNRIPNSDDPQIECEDGSVLEAKDARLILLRIDVESHIIRAIVGMSPQYIVANFGEFSKPTIKHQMIISGIQRKMVMGLPGGVLIKADTPTIREISTTHSVKPVKPFNQWPAGKGEVMAIEVIRDLVAVPLTGKVITSARTKNRGQALERLILEMLGYDVHETASLEGQYPDVKNQLLEIKIQDAPTVDFGKYTPTETLEVLPKFGVTTKDIRYMIVLMDKSTNCVQGIVLMPGGKLGDYFSHVDGVSGKCQRSIPMTFFDSYDGRAVFNP
ncbi:hypothetical protein [Lewinella sp. JB7]|uniref:hypothetical protein n=1 Tax=Lewinella sp. JB7 TaxID=2962887 RepID=UPI0020CA0380|nr:hypothetical protein [Lewinella sp. JB7]MCP9237920.1 hypothetical protein [Lewinella sp. JB7]